MEFLEVATWGTIGKIILIDILNQKRRIVSAQGTKVRESLQATERHGY